MWQSTSACTRQFFTKSFLGDDAAVLASSGEEPAPSRLSSRRRVDGVEVDAMIQRERAVKSLISTQGATGSSTASRATVSTNLARCKSEASSACSLFR